MKLMNITKIVALIPLIIACNMSVANNNDKVIKNDSNAKGFAVLELFTSEGCSSCPPADAVLATLSEEYKGKVYALGFHVDYWNRLGWIDSFSNTAFSRRQENYAVQFHLNSIYTPQLVINGKSEMVGSDESKAKSILGKELENRAMTSIQLAAKQNENGIIVSYAIDKSSNDILNIALVQLNTSTNVKNGENGGRILHHINVVRDFKTVEINTNLSKAINLDMPKGFVAKDYKVISYLQNKDSLQIIAAAETTIQ